MYDGDNRTYREEGRNHVNHPTRYQQRVMCEIERRPYRSKTQKSRRIDQSIAMYAMVIKVKMVAPVRMKASAAFCTGKAMMSSRCPLI